MAKVGVEQWRDQHAGTRFPFADTATLRHRSGRFLSSFLFVDASLYPPAVSGPLYLTRLEVTRPQVTLWVGDEVNPQACSATFAPGFAASLRLLDEQGRASGLLLSTQERLTTLQSWPDGVYDFEVDQTEFVSSVCLSRPPLLEGFVLPDGTAVTGDIILAGADGVQLTLTPVKESIGGELVDRLALRVNAVGEPNWPLRFCGDPRTPTPAVQQIIIFAEVTGSMGETSWSEVIAAPDHHGKFRLTTFGSPSSVSSPLRILVAGNRLTFSTTGTSAE